MTVSYEAVYSAVLGLINANLAGSFKTLKRRQDVVLREVANTDCPMALVGLRRGSNKEQNIAGHTGVGGRALRTWDMVTDILAYYTPAQTTSASDFEALVESVKSLYRSNPFLGGNANTSTEALQWFGQSPRDEYPDLAGRNGLYGRRATLTVQVQEEIQL